MLFCGGNRDCWRQNALVETISSQYNSFSSGEVAPDLASQHHRYPPIRRQCPREDRPQLWGPQTDTPPSPCCPFGTLGRVDEGRLSKQFQSVLPPAGTCQHCRHSCAKLSIPVLWGSRVMTSSHTLDMLLLMFLTGSISTLWETLIF